MQELLQSYTSEKYSVDFKNFIKAEQGSDVPCMWNLVERKLDGNFNKIALVFAS